MNTNTILSRQYIPQSLVIKTWQDIEPFYQQLKSAELASFTQLQNWLAQRSELETMLQEEMGWRYIRMTCDTQNKNYETDFNYFVTDIEPHCASFTNDLNQMFLACPYHGDLDSRYANFIRTVKSQVAIFRPENIPLKATLQQKEQQYGAIAAAMTVDVDGKTLTLQQAAVYLKDNDRTKRELVYKTIANRRLADADTLQKLFTELVNLRQQIAANAGFTNYRDYAFEAMCRFDYTANDCFNFHNSIAKCVMPLCNVLDANRKSQLKVESYKPWDTEVDAQGLSTLKPFSNGEQMLDKSIACFDDIDPMLGNCLRQLKTLQRVDLDSRIGKAPGGYNYPLYETNVPFIFMNASGLLRDLVTMVHEGGHAIHSVVSSDLPYVEMKSFPSEVAELASMSMELISMEHWHVFFDNKDDLKRARREHLEDVLTVLPWIAAVDKFQHLIYTNENNENVRLKLWNETFNAFSSSVINWQDCERFKTFIWQKQLHIFEVPFYYIEYGMAQLGAIAMWRNYKLQPAETIQQYVAALQLGYTKSISQIYEAAGVRFDFSESYINELMKFVQDELNAL
ncbi:MAG: M3 family oligoendopeptidase [Bacteroidia bacterium]|nr:M3 family oligoendopeptidase [Bacteroidia bacterium]